MAEVKWIKIVTEIFDNKKIRIIESMPEGDSIIVIWFKLLMLAGNINDGGTVYFTKDIPYTEQMLATLFNRPLTTIQLALSTFEKFQMIEIVDEIIKVSNWEKYQNIDGLEKIREQTRLRVSKYRERKQLECNVTRNVTVTQGNATDIDIDKDKDIYIGGIPSDNQEVCKPKSKPKSKSKRQFVPPTLEEVTEYCKERKNNVNPKAFYDYFTAGHWIDAQGKPVLNWKQKIITWENGRNKPTQKKESYNVGEKNDYDFDALERSLLNG